jgi:hypothetical protein
MRTAIVEVVLIAIGVFAALAVDQWNGNRADRRLEIDYLARIHRDIQSDVEMSGTWISYIDRKVNFLRTLAEEESLTIDSSNAEEYWNNFNLSMLYGLPARRSATFDEMVSTGRLALIQDTALRDAIAYYYAEYQAWVDVLTDDAPREYSRLATEIIPYDTYYSSDVLRNFELEKIRSSFGKLRSDSRFNAATNAEINYASSVIASLRVLESKTDRVLALFE